MHGLELLLLLTEKIVVLAALPQLPVAGTPRTTSGKSERQETNPNAATNPNLTGINPNVIWCAFRYKNNMPNTPHAVLSRRERQIMDILYRRGKATAAEVRDELPGEPSDSTVRTQLRVLEDKGHVSHEEQGLRYV